MPLAMFSSTGFARKCAVTLRAHIRDAEMSRLVVANDTCCQGIDFAAALKRAAVRSIYNVSLYFNARRIFSALHTSVIYGIVPYTRYWVTMR
jgi:hypothetical protein